MKIAIVADSTAVMGEVADENLYSIPLKIIFDQKSFEDGIDLSQNDFFELLETSSELPTTSQPAIGEVEIVFKDLLKSYDHVIYITLSSKISGTYNSGMMARQLIDDSRVTVIDSLSTSIIQKLMVIDALKMVKEKKTVEDIKIHLEILRNGFEIYLVVDDLKHLFRTGRVSQTSASIGSMLKIKPILKFIDGQIDLYKKVRSVKKAHQTLVDLVVDAELQKGDYLMIAHAHGIEYAESLQKELQKKYPDLNVGIDALSPVISVHTGPKTIGVGWAKL